MKIACQSCQAKYTIADEKVVGKVVKIRCKKCGSTIVVNGQEGGQAAPEEPTEVRGTGEGAADADAWTVNVADNDQRTMTTHQVVAEFAKGTISDETYCWRDGMGDWLPLREIEELAAACGLSSTASAFAHQPDPPPAAASSPASVRPQAATAVAGGLFGAAPQPAAAAAARRGGRAGGADLFGAAAEAGGENDVMTSAPNSAHGRGAPVDDGKMTGQRNENSVLFSLNALTATEPKKNGAEKLAGAAEGDGSGLIDIRALSSSMTSTGPKKPNHADDIMNLGGGGAFSAALAAPVLTAPPLDSGDAGSGGAAANSKIMLIGGGLAAILIVGFVAVYFALKPAIPPVVATTDGTPPTGQSAAAPTTSAPAVAAPPPSAVAAVTPDPAPVAATDPMKPTGGSKRSTSSAGGGNAAPPPPQPVADNTPPPAPKPAGGAKSLEQLMQQSAGGGSAPSNPAPSTASNAPFDRGAAAAALGAIADGASSCKKPNGPTGDGHVSITFSPGGSVVSAIVDQPPFAGTAVGGCVAGKFRGAHVPAFSGGNLTIGKRFSIN